jgi:hypothetical protein
LSATGLRLRLVPSPLLAAAIVALHAVAAACAWLVTPGVAGALLALALLALGLASAWGRALLRSAASVRAIEIDGDSLALELAGGERIAAQAAERRYVSRFAVSLPLHRPRRTVLITAGMMAEDDFRRLRIWALWGRLPGVAAAQLPA